MTDDELVAGPSAGHLDVWARVAALGVVVGLIIGLVPWMLGATGLPVVLTIAVLTITPATVAIAFGARSLRVAHRERAAGYSTLYDVAGFALRDPRTLELLRAPDVAPTGTQRRSLLRGMLTVKPGTILAQRLEDDERRDDGRDERRA